jgi:hypothetical protein
MLLFFSYIFHLIFTWIALSHIFIFWLLIIDVTFTPLQILSQIVFTRGRGGGIVWFGLVFGQSAYLRSISL